MDLVQDDGKPDIFLTMTCNPKWPEIVDDLLPGQTSQDRPDRVARVFRAKLEDLKDQLFKKHTLGKVNAYVYVIEFQKRGLPHAHLLLIMRPEHKMTNPDHYDKIVSAEIPHPNKYPKLHELVLTYMMHGPCGNLRHSSPCMQGEPKKCCFRFPKQFNKATTQGDDSYPLYRRRDNGIHVNVCGHTLDNRYIAFTLSQIHPYVMSLHLHLPNQQLVSFKDSDKPRYVMDRERDKKSMLTAFFERNKTDVNARKYLYKDFPKHYTWNASLRTWNPRQRGAMIGRLVSANPAEGERYYLRLLVQHVTGLTSFEDLYRANNERRLTFWRSCLERGLIECDDSLSRCLTEASMFQFPKALRRLFATILIFCEPGDVHKLWDDHYDSLYEDYRRQYANADAIQSMVLTDVKVFLQSMGKRLDDFDLPKLNVDVNVHSGGFREVQEEYSIVVEVEHLRACNSFNNNQKAAYDDIMRHVDNDHPGVFFIDGPGGTGKTFLYRALLAEVRSRGFIALATASSGDAANNMPEGRTVHSRFKIPINLNNNSVCNIKKQSGAAQLFRDAKIIIWDEASMAKRQAVEAVDRTIQDIIGVTLPFGGKIMILGGDFRQFLLVVRRGTRAQIVDSSLRMSPLWSSIKKIRLTMNMRARNDPWFSDFLLRVGDGNEEAIEKTYIRIPDDMAIPYTEKTMSVNALIDAIFPPLHLNGNCSDDIISRAILSTKNENVDEINDQLINRFCGEEKVYYSFDEAEDDKNNFYPVEFLNSMSVSGLPPHYLRLKVGCPIILIRNLNPSDGLCNGTRLICRRFQQNVIDAEIATGQHSGKRIFIHRIPLCPSDDDMFLFKLKRMQFPVRLSFAMTINKAQGQTIPHVGVYLPNSVFSHGQLYVALSRGISRGNTKVLVKPAKAFNRDGVYTSNVVYQEVLHDE